MIDFSDVIEKFKSKTFEYEQFLAGVLVFFNRHPSLNSSTQPIIHSIKSRIKDINHFEEKLKRKFEKGHLVTVDNFQSEVTDIIGVRILHLHQEQFEEIHSAILTKIESNDWVFVEDPKAYTWDPESVVFYNGLGLVTEQRDTYYTSIHYLVKPNNSNSICCEIQVRTLFEEIWGEIDHTINYPNKTSSVACSEQLRVLSKLVSTGTRLADSIFRSHNDHMESKKQ